MHIYSNLGVQNRNAGDYARQLNLLPCFPELPDELCRSKSVIKPGGWQRQVCHRLTVQQSVTGHLNHEQTGRESYERVPTIGSSMPPRGATIAHPAATSATIFQWD
jgi:hypothetical protein